MHWFLMFSPLMIAATVEHPVYPPQYSMGAVPKLRSDVAQALSMPPRELYEFVPDCSGIFFCGCPHCDGGAQEHAMVWQFGMGDTVKCRHCGMVFPNGEYPNNREKVIIAPSGARQVYRWHENAQGRQYFYEARAWYEKWQWTRQAALKFANLYALTGDTVYGDRACAIIGRYAEVYPDYAIRFDYPFAPVRFFPADQKYPYDDLPPFRGAKFYWWGYGDIPSKLCRAYDLLAADYDFSRLNALFGEGIEKKIKTDLIRLGYEFAAANPDGYGNMSPSLYAHMIEAGRVIGEPEFVHEGVSRAKTLVESQFYFDGWWREAAPSYHWQTIGNLRNVAQRVEGYSDPPDWPEPRLDNFDLMSRIPLLEEAFEVGQQGCLPNGRLMPLNDTWWFGTCSSPDAVITRLWPGMGHAILAAGKGEDAFQVHINWNAGFGHTHLDSGAILLFAHGRELLSDIGYTHTRYRNWTINSASHNLVVVDERSQALKMHDAAMTGNVLFFDAGHPRVQAIEVDVSPVYPQCPVYRRRLLHVHVAEGRDYVVDWFDVEGGAMHDYFLHGCADEQGAFECSAPLEAPVESLVPEWGGTEPYTGENCIDVVGETFHVYDLLAGIRSGEPGAVFRADWLYEDGGLSTFLAAGKETTAYRFTSPAVRGAGKDDAKLGDFLMNGLMLRRKGGKSRFIAVHVPYRESAWVDDVTVMGGELGLRMGGVTHRVAWTDAGPRVESSEGWRYGVQQSAGGEVEAVERGQGFAFVSDRAVPAAKWVRLDFGGARSMVYAVHRCEGNRFILGSDPGFAYPDKDGGARFVYHPAEVLPGPVSWRTWETASER